MDQNLRELYQEIILDHSRHPRHFGRLAEANRTAEGFNPLCGDKVKIDLVVDGESRIADLAFEGKGCAISVASASLMSEMLKGRTVEEAENLMAGFLELVKGGSTEEVKCATLAWHAMKSALNGGGVTKTE
jgi:nitrogen fixation NifU-like protein